MYLVIEETGEATLYLDEITKTMEEEYQNGVITIIDVGDQMPDIYNGNGDWIGIPEREVY